MCAWPVDAHVHLHEPGRVAVSLDAAARNFRAAGGRGDGCLGGLLLAQAADERIFEHLCETRSLGSWSFARATGEPETLIARCEDSCLAVTCGRQVRASEGLEVLALGTLARIEDGRPLAEAIEAARRSGGLPVLPWGFGKWLGARGGCVRSVLAALGPEILFVGDNGGRLALAGEPAALAEARHRGFRVLPGSDPFPLAGDYRRIGGFGFLADVSVEEDRPWGALRAWLLDKRSTPRAYGRACKPMRFMVNQAGIQVRNRLLPKRRR